LSLIWTVRNSAVEPDLRVAAAVLLRHIAVAGAAAPGWARAFSLAQLLPAWLGSGAGSGQSQRR
jgi:hypothetical protein